MTGLESFLLPSLTLLPLLGAVVISVIPGRQTQLIRWVAAITTFLALLLSVSFCFHYDISEAGYQFQSQLAWLPAYGISYHVGLDGISCVLVLLHAICSFSAVFVSFSIEKRVKEYFIFLLLLITSIFGVFSAIDLFCLYIFYEMAVMPLYPLIVIWGSKNKEYAAMKLTIYITGGAVLAFVGLLALYHATGLQTFDLIEIQRHLANHPLPISFQTWCAFLFIFGFGVIASLWPLHSWSPIGYAAAPAAVSMLHAGVLKTIGIYAIIRLAIGLLPQGAQVWLPLVATLAVINILYGAWAAMSQDDLKFVIGFASVSHMGYALLGVSAFNQTALTGVVFFLFAHGVMAALSFALIGFMDHQTHTRQISDFGGLAKQIPFVAVCFTIACLASSGLPGFANFVSEIIIFFGSWQVRTWQTVLAIFGMVITATYMLRMIRQVFFGPLKAKWHTLRDPVSWSEKLPFALLIIILTVFGFWPAPLLQIIQPSVSALFPTVMLIHPLGVF